MQKLEVIDAELARLHATYGMLMDGLDTDTPHYELVGEQLTLIQDKITSLYDILEAYDDGDAERYPISDLMNEPTYED